MEQIDLKRLSYCVKLSFELEQLKASRFAAFAKYKLGKIIFIDDSYKQFAVLKNKRTNELHICIFVHAFVTHKQKNTRNKENDLLMTYNITTNKVNIVRDDNEYDIIEDICSDDIFDNAKIAIDKYLNR